MHRAVSFAKAPQRLALLARRRDRPRLLYVTPSRPFIAAAYPVEDQVSVQTPVELTDTQLRDLKRKFATADGNYDLQAVNVLESAVGQPVKEWFPEAEMDEIYGQGYLKEDQLSRLFDANLAMEGKMREYRTAFDAVDASGNGTINYDELSDLMRFLELSISDTKLTELMVQYDKDSSGQIEFDEFLMMFQDELLDLKEVLRYSTHVVQEPRETRGLIRLKKGCVTKIFSEKEFDEILERNVDALIVIFAGLTWCRPCRAMNRTYEKFAASNQDVIFLKFFGNANASTKSMFVQRLKAKATPAFFFFRNKEMVYSFTGNSKQKFEDHLNEYK